MRGTADRNLPAVSLDHVARMDFLHQRHRPLSRRRPAASLENIDAALVLDARADIGPVDSFRAEEQIGHASDGRRSVYFELGDPVRTLVPALEDEARVIHAVIIVQVAEERVPQVDGAATTLDQPMMGAGAVVHHDEVIANLEEVARTLPLERWRGRSCSQQRDLNRPLTKTLRRRASRKR